jgi:hypothetical protein
MTEAMLVDFLLLSRPVRPFLLVTARRADAIGVKASGPIGIALPDFCSAGEIFSLASRCTEWGTSRTITSAFPHAL